MKIGADGGGCFPTGQHYPGIAHLMRVAAAGLAEEFAGEQSVADLPIAAIDTETTGRSPTEDRVVEVACVLWRGGEVVARHSWLVNPGRPIPGDASRIHGITDSDVSDQPRFEDIANPLLEALAGYVPLAYNAPFDRDFLLAEFARLAVAPAVQPPASRRGVEWLDPLVWARHIQRNERSRALGEVCKRLGIDLENAHRATDDAEAALRVMLSFASDARVPDRYAAFIQEQRRLSRQFAEERLRWRRN